jgi:hypothetical protein
MTGSSALLIALAATTCGVDPEGERILSRLKDHFAQINSIRVQGTENSVTSGGLWDANPETSRTVKNLDGKTVEFDLWSNHPKHRWYWTERSARTGALLSATQEFFDGQEYSLLFPDNRSGLTMKGGARATMPSKSALHAIGFCFVDTYQTSLATVLCESPKVTVQRIGAEGSNEWVIESKGLPKDLRPRDWNDKARKQVFVKVWLTVDPKELRVNRWAVYDPGPPHPVFGKPLPAFQLDAYNLAYAFANIYDKEKKKSGFQTPKRVLLGNGNATYEVIIKEMLVNPREAGDTFRPSIPAGYSITKASEDGTTVNTVTGGHQGAQQRAQEITKQAREILVLGEQLRAPVFRWSDWIWPGTAVFLLLAGVATFLFVKRRKNT